MTVIERTGGIRAFLVERYLPVYPIYLTLWVVAVESMTAVVTDNSSSTASMPNAQAVFALADAPISCE